MVGMEQGGFLDRAASLIRLACGGSIEVSSGCPHPDVVRKTRDGGRAPSVEIGVGVEPEDVEIPVMTMQIGPTT